MKLTKRFLFLALLLICLLVVFRACQNTYVVRPKAIVVHVSASRWGDANSVRQWHIRKGWGDIGYHAVILNGRRSKSSLYDARLDGKIEPGRLDDVVGAHCSAGNMNARSLGVCLIGEPGQDGYPTPRQIDALIHYCAVKCREYAIPVTEITQHSDHEPGKPFCASLNMNEIRRRVKAELDAR